MIGSGGFCTRLILPAIRQAYGLQPASQEPGECPEPVEG